MTEQPLIDISPENWRIVSDILQRLVPDREVWAFGSRAKWSAKEYSDLDIAIIGDEPLGLTRTAELTEAFQESALPFKVDVVDWAATTPSFREVINAGKVVLQKARNTPQQWPTVRLGDHCIKIGSGATPKGGKEAYLEHGPYSLIRSQNVYNDGFKWDGLAYISDDQAKKLDGVAVCTGDVLLNITGDSVARVCSAPEKVIPARVNQHVAIIRPDASSFDSRFIRYFLASPKQQELLLGMASAGATRNALTKGMIEDFSIPKPLLNEQTEIADVLTALDDKILLLQETNSTLEAIAQALFKSWFVDFDPVRAKAEGREPEGVPPEIAELFPSEFEDSELGEIPKGWKVDSLDNIATYLNGLALQKYPAMNGEDWLPVIKIAQLRKGSSEDADKASTTVPADYVIGDGDVLFSWSGSLEVAIWCGGKGALNQHLFKVASGKYPKWFYYLWTKRHLPAFREIAAHKATTMGHIQRCHLTEAKVLIPDEMLLDRMSAVICPLIERATNALLQARTLGLYRDELLPKLMSGQLRTPENEF